MEGIVTLIKGRYYFKLVMTLIQTVISLCKWLKLFMSRCEFVHYLSLTKETLIHSLKSDKEPVLIDCKGTQLQFCNRQK